MRLYTYKNNPAINLDLVQSFGAITTPIYIESKRMLFQGVTFKFGSHEVRWETDTKEEADNVYNAIINSLTKEYQNHTHII